ncbi:flagellar hook-associated protein FlgK [Yersinia rohdei]|nr:flagellar hook-associated protein FlgK [Yersinia rohdei]
MNFIKTALSGTKAAQAHLDATAMNVANMKTPGYSRQRAEQSALGASGVGAYAGNGVNVDGIKRISDHYLVKQEWQANSQSAYFNGKQRYLDKLESVVSTESTSLSKGLNEFYAALDGATLIPDSLPQRQNIINRADALALRINNTNMTLSEQKQSIANQRASCIDQINVLTSAIADYNKKIVHLDSIGTNSNALIDNRDKKINELSTLIETRSIQAKDGSLSLSLRNGQPLVSGSTAASITANVGRPGLNLNFVGTQSLIDMSCGGQLGSLHDYETGTLNSVQETIQNIANQLATEFNRQLLLGTDLEGNVGVELFDFQSANPKGILQVNAISLKQLALAGSNKGPGDNTNLHALIAIKDKPITFNGIQNTKLSDAAFGLLSDIGVASGRNKTELTAARDVLNQAIRERDSVSSVDKDEEAINLMEYQRVYQSNIKVVSTGDQLFRDLLALF